MRREHEEQSRRKDRLEGRRDALQARLQSEQGVSSLKELEALLAELREEREELERVLEEGMAGWEAKHGEGLGDDGERMAG